MRLSYQELVLICALVRRLLSQKENGSLIIREGLFNVGMGTETM